MTNLLNKTVVQLIIHALGLIKNVLLSLIVLYFQNRQLKNAKESQQDAFLMEQIALKLIIAQII